MAPLPPPRRDGAALGIDVDQVEGRRLCAAQAAAVEEGQGEVALADAGEDVARAHQPASPRRPALGGLPDPDRGRLEAHRDGARLG